MGQFTVRTSAEDHRIVVTVAGECDLSSQQELTSVLLTAIGGAPQVVADLGVLEFLDSSGIHCLVVAHHAAERAGRAFFVVNATGIVADVLDLTGVADLLTPPSENGDPLSR